MANNQAYGFGQPLRNIFPSPVVAERAPGNGDKLEIGREWVNTVAQDVYFLAGYSGGNPVWINSAGGAGLFASLTVTPGPTALTGAFTVTSGVENVSIGADAADHDVAIGSATGSSSLAIQWGTGGATLSGAAGGALIIGAAAQTSALTFGRSTAANTLNIGTGINTGAQSLNLSTGASAADSTINALSGIATAGTQTFNLFTGASTSTGQAVNIMNGAGSGTRVFTLAGSGALATTIGIGDGLLGNTITIGNGINSVAQSVSIANGAAAADSTVNILSGLATAGVQTLNLANGEYAKAINIGNGALGNTILMANGVNSVAQTVSIANGASAADSTVNVLSGTGTAGAAALNMANNPRVTVVDIADVAPAASRTITVGGGTVVVAAVTDTIDVGVDGATTNADSAKVVNIGTGAVDVGSNTVNIGTGALTTSGTNSVNISTGAGVAGGTKRVTIGNVDGLTDIIELVPRESSAGAAHTLNASKGRITATGLTTAAGADETITITNSSVSATSGIIVGICTLGANDARPVLERVVPGAGSFTIQYVNEGAAALNGDLIISFEVFN